MVNDENTLCKYSGNNIVMLCLQKAFSTERIIPKHYVRVEKRPFVNIECSNKRILKFKFKFNNQADEFEAHTRLVLIVNKLKF